MSKRRLKAISQFLVILLALDAGWVAIGLAKGMMMQWWIVTYWIILTLKNAVDYFAGRPNRVHDSGDH